MGKLQGQRPRGRPERRWENNIKLNLREILCGGRDWIELEAVQWQVFANAIMNLQVP
jgi:hypothetical protein